MTQMPLPVAFSVHLLGWALLHFLWQGAALGLLYMIVRTVLPRGEARYRWGMLMLVLMAACPFWTMWKSIDVGAPHSSVSAVDLGVIEGIRGASWSWGEQLDALVPWLVLVWATGVLLLSLRVGLQWRGLRQLARAGTPLAGWDERVAEMAALFHLSRPVRVLCSHAVAAPALLGGWLRPVILMPVAVACEFPVRQIELILAHEMAHLRRWDPAANLFQIILETLHFYHPVVRWISRDVRHEREICCDEMALSIGGGSRREFVSMLADLGDLQERQSDLLVAFAGGSLLDRVQHMVMVEPEAASVRAPARFLTALICASVLACVLQVQWKEARLQRSLHESVARLELLALPHSVALVPPQLSWHMSTWLPLQIAVGKVHEQDASPSATVIPAISKTWHIENPASPPALTIEAFVPGPLALPTRTIETRVGTMETAPVPVYIRQPLYPRAALNSGIQGRVVVEFTLDDEGRVSHPSIAEAIPAGVFDQSAMDALRHWKYAAPSGAARSRIYRQTLAFDLSARRQELPVNDQATVQVRAQVPCEMVTGTHICHMPAANMHATESAAQRAGAPQGRL